MTRTMTSRFERGTIHDAGGIRQGGLAALPFFSKREGFK